MYRATRPTCAGPSSASAAKPRRARAGPSTRWCRSSASGTASSATRPSDQELRADAAELLIRASGRALCPDVGAIHGDDAGQQIGRLQVLLPEVAFADEDDAALA